MKPVLLLLVAAATIGAVPPRPSAPSSRYWAGGFEPSWSFVIEHGRMIFDPHTGDPVINVPLPRRQPIRNGYRYDTRELFVTIRHVRCDSYDGRTSTDTVHPSRAVEAGCGGTAIPPSSVVDSGWRIGSAAGVPPGAQDIYSFGFGGDGRVSIVIGCNRYSGAYRVRGRIVTVGRLAGGSAYFCWPSPMQAPLLAILRNPVRISWTGEGDTLLLTGRGGSIRLEPN